MQALGFALPMLCIGLASGGGQGEAWCIAPGLQFPGLLAERWFFFAQANHPQNLYYQAVS